MLHLDELIYNTNINEVQFRNDQEIDGFSERSGGENRLEESVNCLNTMYQMRPPVIQTMEY